MLKNIIILLIAVAIVKYFILPTSEKFTPHEMKNYKKMLKNNCDKATEIRNKVKKMNALRCNPLRKGKTERDTINNKRLCYDDIYKEIVAELDTESNCVMHKRLSKSDPKISGKTKTSSKSSSSKPLSKSTKSKSSKSKSDIVDEGPEFINQFYLPTRDTKRAENLASTKFGKSNMLNLESNVFLGDVSSNKFSAKGSYDNVAFSSDPSFLYQLSKNKPIIKK
jgi:hypothetical protein